MPRPKSRKACNLCKRVCPLRIPNLIAPCNYYSKTPIFTPSVYVEMLQLRNSIS